MLSANKKNDFHMTVHKAQKGHDCYTLQENNSEVFTYSTEHINNSWKYWLWRPKPEQQMAQSEEKLYLWTSHNFLYSVLHITGTYVPLHQRSQTYGW